MAKVKCIVALLFSIQLGLAGCANTSTSATARADQLRDLLSSDPSRAAADKVRDDGRQPADVVAFLGIEKGMTVLDVFAGGGYYSEVLARAVESDGKVYAQNPPAFGARFETAFKEKFDGRLPQVEYLVRDLDDLGLPPASFDAAITALNFHDVYNRDPAAGISFLQAIYAALKPGGILGVIDHAGNDDADNNANLHRMSENAARDAAKQAGFVVEAGSDLLRHSDDDRSQPTRNTERGYTDRFVLKLRKPT